MATGDKLVNLDDLKEVYTKVDGDVGELKSALNETNTTLTQSVQIIEKNIYNSATDVTGKRLANAGYEITDENYNSSDYIDITGYANLYIAADNSVAGTSSIKICFYDNTKTNISDSYIGKNISGQSGLLEISPIPVTAKYIRFNYESAKISNIYIGIYADPYLYIPFGAKYYIYSSDETKQARGDFNTIGDRFDALDNADDELDGKINAVATISKYDNRFILTDVTAGKSLTTGGELATDANYSVSGFIKISDLPSVYIATHVSPGNQSLRICFYNSDKTNIANTTTGKTIGSSGTVPNDTLSEITIPSGAVYLRFHYATDYVSNQFIGYYAEPAKYYFDGYGVHYTAQESYTKKAEYWGDSLTNGNQDGTGVTRPKILQTLLGQNWNVRNFGVGGEKSNAIAARASGIFAVIMPGITIPADGSTVNLTGHLKDIYGNDITFGSGIYSNAYNAWITVNPCVVDGVECILQKANSSSPITIKLQTAGNAIVITRPTYIVMNSETLEKGPVLLICVGQNEGFNRDADELISQIDGIIKSRNASRFIVYGLPHSLSGYTWQAAINEKLKMHYGKQYYDIEAYMKTPIYSGETIVSSYALQDAGLTPTADDLTAIGNNVYPPSIMYDGVHFNQYGYQVWANREYLIGKWLGYWE